MPKFPHYVILDPGIGNGKIPIPCDDPIQWANWFENNFESRVVGSTHIGTIHVSTVFLGLDHSFSGDHPMYFETMAFDESDKKMIAGIECREAINHVFERYPTWEAAEIGHMEWVEKISKSLEV